MKKSALLLLTFIGLTLQTNAQEISKNAIGIRLSESNGFGPEVNYQRALGDANRLELGLAWHSERYWEDVKFTAIYQWVWNIEGGFNWYVGAGGGVGQVDFDDDIPGFDDDTETYIYAAGDIGIEYDFDFPLLLSLDFRPEIGFGDFNDDVDFDIALGVRYQF